MSAELPPDLQLEIAHLLLIDVVGYSKLLVNDQVESLQQLNRIVRSTDCFRAAEAKDKLIRLPTGDGMALLFFESPEQPVRCALEIAQALRTLFYGQAKRESLIQCGKGGACRFTGYGCLTALCVLLHGFEAIRRCWPAVPQSPSA